MSDVQKFQYFANKRQCFQTLLRSLPGSTVCICLSVCLSIGLFVHPLVYLLVFLLVYVCVSANVYRLCQAPQIDRLTEYTSEVSSVNVSIVSVRFEVNHGTLSSLPF